MQIDFGGSPMRSASLLLCGVGLFLSAMLTCLLCGITIIWALLLGICLFFLLAAKQGHSPKSLLQGALTSARGLLGLVAILLLLGTLTASWRASGTVLLFVYYGVQSIWPPLFLLLTFILTCLLCYILGSVFGTAGIMGAIFMTIGAAGGVDPRLTAGVIMSGLYFGDRTSPAAASFLTISVICRQNTTRMLRSLLKSGILPLALSALLYGGLSLLNPLQTVDASILRIITDHCRLTPWLLLPAGFILFFPLLRLKLWQAMTLSALSAGILSITVQGMSLPTLLLTCLRGYRSPDAALGTMLNGGGMLGMVEICVIIFLSSMLAPLLQNCGLVELVRPALGKAVGAAGKAPVTTAMVLVMNALFCNQTSPLYLADAFLRDYYEDDSRFAADLCEASILAGVIPWSLACSVPLSFLGASPDCLPFAFFIYLAPLCGCLKHWKK